MSSAPRHGGWRAGKPERGQFLLRREKNEMIIFCLILHVKLTLPLRRSSRTSQTLTSSKRRKFKNLSRSTRVGLLKLINTSEVGEGRERWGTGPDPARGKTGGTRGSCCRASREKANPRPGRGGKGCLGRKGESEPFGEGCKRPAGTRITRQHGSSGVGTGSEAKWGDGDGTHVLNGTRWAPGTLQTPPCSRCL